jgi:hypothetical protein
MGEIQEAFPEKGRPAYTTVQTNGVPAGNAELGVCLGLSDQRSLAASYWPFVLGVAGVVRACRARARRRRVYLLPVRACLLPTPPREASELSSMPRPCPKWRQRSCRE